VSESVVFKIQDIQSKSMAMRLFLPKRIKHFFAFLTTIISLVTNAQTDRYWSGGGSFDTISDVNNWVGLTNPNSGDNLNFNNTVGGHHFVYSDYGLGSYFNTIITYSGSGAFQWYGDTTYANKFENNNSPNILTILSHVYNRGNTDFEINPKGSGGITFLIGSGLTIQNGKLLNINGGNILTVNSVIDELNGVGNIKLTNQNPTVILNNNCTYSGLTTIDGGILQLNALGGALKSGNSVIINGGTLRIMQSQTLGNLALNSGALQVDAGVTLTITGVYTATGGNVNNLGSIKFVGNSVTFPGLASINNGSANTLTSLEAASSGVVTINSLLNVTGSIAVSSGTLALAGYNLHLNNSILSIDSGAIFDNGGENQIINDGNGSISISGTFITRDVDGFVGSNTAIPTIVPTINNDCTIEYGLGGNQVVQGLTAPTYQNITFSNGGTKTLISKNNAVGTIIISGTTVFDASNNNFGSSTSNVIMTGTSKYKLSGTIYSKPESGGIYSLGQNTTFEFTGSSVTNIRLSSPIIMYANIIVSGTNVSNPGASTGIKFQTGGTFIVKNGATFKIFNSNGFTGATNTAINNTNAPTVILETGSTIEYAGADQTITLAPSPSAYSSLIVSGEGVKTIPISELFIGNNLNVNASTLKIESGKTITVANAVFVNAAATMTFESNDSSQSGSLIQLNDADANSGNIKYDRTTTPILNTDYTYWSSPVYEQTLLSVSPNTPLSKFYLYNPTIENWAKILNPATDKMTVGKGYIFLGPKTYSTAALYKASFIGKPNNGNVQIPIVFNSGAIFGTSNLIGNPYPSAIDADSFLDENVGVLDGTIYFWTHNTSLQLASGFLDPSKAGSGIYAYTTDDYATYNKTGGISTTNGTGTKAPSGVAPLNANIPNGNIVAGQAFFVTAIANGNAIFNNAMRISGGASGINNAQFFKNTNSKNKIVSSVKKNRIWLDLTNDQGAFKQTLVGYVEGATNDYDSRYDGLSFDGNVYIDFYSVNKEKNLAIQGRALPFDENDEVPLGFKTSINGDFTIKIDQADGLLIDQAVFIKDKLTNAIFDLRSVNCTFSTPIGTFNDRFVLRFVNKTLATKNFEIPKNQVLISNKNKQIKINSLVEIIDKVTVFDLLGKEIYQNNKVNSNELTIPNLASSQQILLVKVTLQNGQSVTNKIMY
jgi:autotransporter-associated beta strand protein